MIILHVTSFFYQNSSSGADNPDFKSSLDKFSVLTVPYLFLFNGLGTCTVLHDLCSKSMRISDYTK